MFGLAPAQADGWMRRFGQYAIVVANERLFDICGVNEACAQEAIQAPNVDAHDGCLKLHSL